MLLIGPGFFLKRIHQDVLHGKVTVTPPSCLRHLPFGGLWLHSKAEQTLPQEWAPGGLVPWILFPRFNKEHSLVTWEGSYQPCVTLGGALLGQEGGSFRSAARLGLGRQWIDLWSDARSQNTLTFPCCTGGAAWVAWGLGCLGLNESPSWQHQEPHWMYWWHHILVHTPESWVSFSLGGGFRD